MTMAEAFAAAFPPLMWVLLAVSAVLCAVGFYKFVYFLSVGYGLAIAGEAVAMLVLYRGTLSVPTGILMLLFIAYGARLSGFLIFREIKSASYRKTLSSATGEAEKPMPMAIKFVIWVSVALLYVGQVSPVYYRMANGLSGETVVPLVGALIMLCGIVMEAVADRQKSCQKRVRPDMVATEGLYRLVRCPNYLGEILFWTGVLVSGCTALHGVFQWAVAVLSYICIVYIMFNGAHRLEARQMKRYGDNADYQKYVSETPILLPFVPLYHLVKQEEK